MIVSLVSNNNSNRNTLFKCCLVKLAILQENLSNSFGLSFVFVFVWSFLKVIIICSFNNKALKKCANDEAFYIMATVSSQFFAALPVI